jgi:hypothetical protein
LTRCHKQNAILEMKTGEAHIVNRLSDWRTTQLRKAGR